MEDDGEWGGDGGGWEERQRYEQPRARGGRDGRAEWGERAAPLTALQRAMAADLDLVYGVSPVLAALRAGRRSVRTLYVQERREGQGGGAGPARKAGHESNVESIFRLAAALDVPVQRLPKGDLNVLSGGRPHQGCVLHCGRLDYVDVADVGAPPEGAATPPVWLVLDEVSDPQNVGALVRSAHFLGAAGVVACKRNSSALTPAVSKASAGAVEAMEVRGVASMPRFLRRARGQGWRVVGAAVAEGAVTAGGLTLGEPTLLVLGSEGRGLRPMVRAECDVIVRIGGQGPAAALDSSVVDSLNVSVAGAILLHQLLGV